MIWMTPLSDFKNIVDLGKIPTANVKIWQLIITLMSLHGRGDFWKAFYSLIIFSSVGSIEFLSNVVLIFM